ncbi:flagella basal body P-ring formation protein FlgA [Actinacidiphila sp. ITFR-21]|uniref:flagella basal body P-ring formation protein FlgA n=1 Tax=Actinacidiphila sp. ITFR-21 TaxID=3075199 RepID=UPI00288C2ADD|nr:flagella basal body P-ring formation protein FlgA [Streptomyces sp. ITFR-21]WNI20112.1 flagella basal body P-ring formation protein FlgA [Streptomyces sp. ITFR-21]
MALTKEQAAPERGPAQAPLPITHDAPRSRRRPVVVGAGLALAAVGALVSVWLVNEAGDKVAVVATRHAIAAGDTVETSDLMTAEISHDSGLRTVPVSRSSEIVGKQATSDLPAGVLVTEDSVSAGSSVTKGKSVVGILAKPGQLPVQKLHTGDTVTIVHTPGDGSDSASSSKPGSTPDSLPAVVSRVGAPDANGAVVVDVAAAEVNSTSLAAWAAGGDVAIVLKADS